MPLKGDRVIIETDTTTTCESVAQQGVVLVYASDGSGSALGDTASAADLVVNPSGFRPAGLLLHNVGNIDQSKFRRNSHNDESVVGERCTLLRKGRVTTNMVAGNPTAKATAYLGLNGLLTPTVSATGGLVATPKVGVFAGKKDEAGFVAVDLNLPVA